MEARAEGRMIRESVSTWIWSASGCGGWSSLLFVRRDWDMDGIRLLMLLSLLLLIFCNISLFECWGGDDIADRLSGLTVDGQNAETHMMVRSAIAITATRSSREHRPCFEFTMVIVLPGSVSRRNSLLVLSPYNITPTNLSYRLGARCGSGNWKQFWCGCQKRRNKSMGST